MLNAPSETCRKQYSSYSLRLCRLNIFTTVGSLLELTEALYGNRTSSIHTYFEHVIRILFISQ